MNRKLYIVLLFLCLGLAGLHQVFAYLFLIGWALYYVIFKKERAMILEEKRKKALASNLANANLDELEKRLDNVSSDLDNIGQQIEDLEEDINK